MASLPHMGTPPSIQELLAGVGFPISKEQLIEHFQENSASPMLLDAIRNANVTRFESADAVMNAIRNR